MYSDYVAPFEIQTPNCLKDLKKIKFKEIQTTALSKESEKLFAGVAKTVELEVEVSKHNFEVSKSPRIAVVFSGGPAPGGHDVVAGIYDALVDVCGKAELVGFLGGPAGLLHNHFKKLSDKDIAMVRHAGGFDLLGTGRTKLKSQDDFAKCAEVLTKHQCTSLIVIGGDDSNTNAAFLAAYFASNNIPISVVGVPKTIDGDLKNDRVPTSFGFHTATQTYAHLISNIARDAISSKKYYHFIRLMGRAASHVTLESALLTRPNLTLISEEIAEKKLTLSQIVEQIVNVVLRRSKFDKNYGVILIPEGLIEHIHEIKVLISELNQLMHQESKYLKTIKTFTRQSEFINSKLTKDASYTFSSLPNAIQRQLLLDRDSHGNVQLSRIETEKLLADLVNRNLKQKKSHGEFAGSFSALNHFFGYEGRCGAPTEFDCTYANALGKAAALLALHQKNGYLAFVDKLHEEVQMWTAGGYSLPAMMSFEKRGANTIAVIAKQLVNTSSPAFLEYTKERDRLIDEDGYRFVPPIQWMNRLSLRPPLTLALDFALRTHKTIISKSSNELSDKRALGHNHG